MASEIETPALDANNPPEQQQVGRNPCPRQSDLLIARIPKSSRQELWVTIRVFNGVTKCELRVHERDGTGNWRATPRQLVIGRAAIFPLINHLTEVKVRLCGDTAKNPAPLNVGAQEDSLSQTFCTDR
jgi:hypothetical protein